MYIHVYIYVYDTRINTSWYTCDWVMSRTTFHQLLPALQKNTNTQKKISSWAASCARMSPVTCIKTHINKSWHTYDWVMTHMSASCLTGVMSHMSHVSHESCFTWVMCHMSHVSHELCVTWVMSHMSHVLHESCVTWVMSHMSHVKHDSRECVMSHTSHVSHVWLSHVSRECAMPHMSHVLHECVMSHMSHVSHERIMSHMTLHQLLPALEWLLSHVKNMHTKKK